MSVIKAYLSTKSFNELKKTPHLQIGNIYFGIINYLKAFAISNIGAINALVFIIKMTVIEPRKLFLIQIMHHPDFPLLWIMQSQAIFSILNSSMLFKKFNNLFNVREIFFIFQQILNKFIYINFRRICLLYYPRLVLKLIYCLHKKIISFLISF